MIHSPENIDISISHKHNRAALVLALVILFSFSTAPALAQLEFENEPINYGKAPTRNPVSVLQTKLDEGAESLEYDDTHGYLPAVLRMLQVKPSSQVLVHSKTSFQLRRISPSRPRALYYNDECYIGWVQGGDVVEVMATDPVQGEIFYTLSQEKRGHPRFIQDRGQCLSCHASSRTQGVPGVLVRSVFVDSSGQPQFGAGTFTIDHRSPFKERWGGYYVTGTHGRMRHMGNTLSRDRENPEIIDREAGANVTSLQGHFDRRPYLTPHSDIVALMVLEHQSQMQNYLTRANQESRSAAHYDSVMSAALDRPADFVSDTTQRRVKSVVDKLLRYLLFADEFQLTAPVAGTSAFTAEFQALGPRDQHGRSLRDFDLQTRMFKHPCSYMIYSPSFDALPDLVKEQVVSRLQAILTGQDSSEEFAHLSTHDRKTILAILQDTKPELWKVK